MNREKIMSKKRLIIYGIIFLFLTLLAWWVFYDPDPLKELKQMETVASPPEEVITAVNKVLKAAEKKDTRTLASYLLNGRDSTEVEMITGMLYASPEFMPAKILHCRRLVKSHRQDNITLYVYSENRKQTYAFSLLKNKKNKYVISAIVPSEKNF